MKSSVKAACAATIVTFAGIGALAHSGATGVVKERMEAMKAMGDAVDGVAAMFRGEAEYDPNAVRAAAETVRGHAGDAMTELFPEGSNAPPSEALDAIWQDWETFAAMAARLEVSAEGLALAAENGPGSSTMPSGNRMGDTGGMMGGTSGSMMGSSSANMMGGSDGMMGGSNGMMGGATGGPDADHLAEMPAEAVLTMMSRTCSACHTRFRAEEV